MLQVNGVDFLKNLSFEETEIASLDELLSTRSYLCDVGPTDLDSLVHTAASKCDKKIIRRYPHLKRWQCHLGSFSKAERAKFLPAFNEQTAQLVALLAKAHADRKVMI